MGAAGQAAGRHRQPLFLVPINMCSSGVSIMCCTSVHVVTTTDSIAGQHNNTCVIDEESDLPAV